MGQINLILLFFFLFFHFSSLKMTCNWNQEMFGQLKFESAKKILRVIMVTWHVKIGYSHLGGQENSVLKYSRTCLKRHCIFPLTPVSDQSRLSPYYIYTKLSRQVVRMEKISNMGLLNDPMPNSLNLHNENRLADSKENY